MRRSRAGAGSDFSRIEDYTRAAHRRGATSWQARPEERLEQIWFLLVQPDRDTHELLYLGLATDLPTRFAQHNGLPRRWEQERGDRRVLRAEEETGGSRDGKRWATPASALLDVFAARRSSLFVARRSLRDLARDEAAQVYEAAIHAARMRATMDAHEPA